MTEDSESRPPLIHAATANQPDRSQSESNSGNDRDHEREQVGNVETNVLATSRPSVHDILLLFGIVIMLTWPWLFFGIVWAKKGIQMNNRLTKIVTNNPHPTTYFITLVSSIIFVVVTDFFSRAIIRFTQELVTRRTMRPFHLRVLLAFRHQTWQWGKNWEDIKYLMTKSRWWPTALLFICVLAFLQLISTTTALITPIPFNRTATLIGTELDFSSTDPLCLDWFRAHLTPNVCDWMNYKGLWYSNCLGENQMVDALEAGRGNLIANNSQSLTFSQLGAKDGLHFLGSIRGVLPIGPNGVPVFDTLEDSPFSNTEVVAGMLSYRYTLNHQGLSSNVSCTYQTTSPIQPRSPPPGVLVYSVPDCTTVGETSVLANVTYFTSLYGTNTLMYWACRSAPNNTQAPSYSIYLLGYTGGYTKTIGNITCRVSLVQPAIFPVTYQSTRGTFSASEAIRPEPISSSSSAFSLLVDNTLLALGNVISRGQNDNSNLLGVKSFGLEPYARADKYLELYARMIQGILEYETTYLRLIYSSDDNRPSSCNRRVTGSVSYEVFGWFVTSGDIGFLIPLTFINGAALIALSLALALAKAKGYLHPLHPRPVVYDPKYEEEVPDEWKEKIAFRPTTILKEHFDSQLQAHIVGPDQGL